MQLKRFVAGIAAGLILLTQSMPALAAAESAFPDVTETRADYNAILFLKNIDLISGYEDGTFKPDQEVNRAEALKMIMGIKDLNFWQKADGPFLAEALVDAPFSDLDKTAWYYPYLQEAYSNSLVAGYPDGTFKPDQTVNTAEAIKILTNYAFLQIDKFEDIKVTEDPFADAPMTEWYAPYLQYAKEKGVALGDAINTIHPDAPITRGMLAQLIYRVYAYDGQTIDKRSITVGLDSGLQKFVVYDTGRKLAELPGTYDDSMEVDAYVKKVTGKYAYVSVCSTGFGGYIWYYFCYGDTYRVNLQNREVVQLNFTFDGTGEKVASFMDVSADQAWTAWTGDWTKHTVYVAPTGVGSTIETYQVPEKYSQFGDVKFSPDGTKLAYAAIVGDPENEQSAVYIINRADGTQTKVTELEKQILDVYGWYDNNNVFYGVVTQN